MRRRLRLTMRELPSPLAWVDSTLPVSMRRGNGGDPFSDPNA
jgi:hypothetical protein